MGTILIVHIFITLGRRMDGVGDVNALKMLPDKLKSELAVNVNLATLKRVTIFKECRPEFLQDLVLKMRPLIFTPGDFVCRKGEIAREMFIIADGVLEVLGRTADVRAVGYADLFVLSRGDVLEALQDHPDAEVLIKEYARKRLQANRELQKKRALKSPSPPYNLLPMVSKSRQLQPQAPLDFELPSPTSTSDLSTQTESSRIRELANTFTERWNQLMTEFIQSYEEEVRNLSKESRSPKI
ncbi:unnamed protein product [Echinostoma caproni]|uniref:Cyclic nucleotide-binding domain-containing protein n=1 Tax=Echinostoma caproni TaxID=27848 RepID=A0A183A624_9TREM|nr:unnamed protein product [Echinostoma caproni]